MVEVITAEKKYPDEKFQKYENKNFGKKHYDIVITKDTDCYWIDNGQKKILFKFRKNVVPKKLMDIARSVYEQHMKKAKGTSFKDTSENGDKKYTYRSYKSKISGFYDRALINHFSLINTKTVCRTTAFTKNNFKEWTTAIPFFETVAKYYKELAPNHYKRQINLFKQCPPGFQIGKTPFTTITTNYNWRTACHKDTGDFPDGMGNITVVGDDSYQGGFLGFPQFKVAVDVRPGDILIMDVHQYHCNTELKADDNNVRLSFVCYFRKNTVNCTKKINLNGETLWIAEKNKI